MGFPKIGGTAWPFLPANTIVLLPTEAHLDFPTLPFAQAGLHLAHKLSCSPAGSTKGGSLPKMQQD